MEKFEIFEKKLKTFIGNIINAKIRYFDYGGCVCDFSIPLKMNKDDEPTWLNCKAYNELGEKFGEYKQNRKVTVQGYFEKSTSKEGKEYLNFIVLLGE